MESIDEIQDNNENYQNPSPIPEENEHYDNNYDESHSGQDQHPFPDIENNSSNNSVQNDDSVPGDEDINESSSHRMLKHNSPQESLRVFRQ